MHDQHICSLDSEVPQQRCHRLTRLVHKRRRQSQDSAHPTELYLADFGADGALASLEGRPVTLRQQGDDIGAQVVPRLGVAFPRVAQADDQRN